MGKAKTAFVFSGIASHWQTMGLRLYQREPIFKSTLEKYDSYLKDHVDISVVNEISQTGKDVNLDITEVSNYCIIGIEIALVELLSSWGIVPDGVTGHSAGSASAAYTAGILDLPDTIKIIHNYSLMIRKLADHGIMAHISEPVSIVENVIKEYNFNLTVAAINSPNATVVVGKNDEIQKIVDHFSDNNIFSRILKTNVPFHSRMVEPHLLSFFNGIEDIKVRAAKLQTYSYLYGVLKTDNNYDAHYWPRMIREPLLFAASIEKMINDGYSIFIEIGPHPVLSQFIHETAQARNISDYSVLSAMRRDEDETEHLIEMVSKLVQIGYDVDLDKFRKSDRKKILNHLQAAEHVSILTPQSSNYKNIDIPAKRKVIIKSINDAIVKASGGLISAPDNLDAGFFDMGIDSVTNISMRENLEKTLGLSLPATLVFDFPNINKLTDYLIKQLNPNDNIDLQGRRSGSKTITDIVPRLNEPIAIIGMGCRFPGDVNSPEDFWDFLIKGRNAVSKIPASRWNAEEYYDADPDKPGKSITKHACFLSDDVLRTFDASFFNISPREAEVLDPQQRILLEVCWEAIERAGILPSKLRGRNVGVYLGFSNDDYKANYFMSRNVDKLNAYSASGSMPSSAGGRISYAFGFEGPNFTIDTACSSSLSALHVAVSALRNGECEIALVAGVNLMLSPNLFIGFSKLGALSPDGISKTFDDSANGYGRGEGVGAILLKRLSDVQADGDNIEALVVGTAVNQDGASSSFIAPNGIAQQDVIERALNNADIEPGDVDYIEAHGTGTSLGDPIEMGALSEIYGHAHSKENPLIVASVKTNIGHLESAAGIAGIIKCVLCLQHELIPAHLHFKKPNRHIPWDSIPIKIPIASQNWERTDKPRRAAVSSFGFSGTNSHIILQEAPDKAVIKSESANPPFLFLKLSARSESALRKLVSKYVDIIKQENGNSIADICYSASTGREDFNHRLAITGKSRDEINDRLNGFLTERKNKNVVFRRSLGSEKAELAFMFTGQGSQYYGMGSELYESQSLFRDVLDDCDRLFKPLIDKSIVSLLYSETADRDLVDQTQLTQPLLFSIEYALSRLWQSWGVEPDAVLGHSIGEFPAAVIAEVFSLFDAVSLVAIRGRLMASAPGNGAMTAVFADKNTVMDLISGHENSVSLAAVNAPESCVISGDAEVLKEIQNKLDEKSIRFTSLKVSQAFHSPLMEPILNEFSDKASEVRYSRPKVRFFSCMTGGWVDEEIASPDYWVKQIRNPVLFAEAVQKTESFGIPVFLEIGPNPTLSHLGLQSAGNKETLFLPSLRRKTSDWDTMSHSLAELYTRGYDIDWKEFNSGYSLRKTILPTYPFERKTFWKEYADEPHQRAPQSDSFIGARISSPALEDTIIYESTYNIDFPDYLKEHKVFNTIINPAVAYLSLTIEALKDHTSKLPSVLENFEFLTPLLLDDSNVRTVQIILKPVVSGRYSVQIVSKDANVAGNEWIIHCRGEAGSQAKYNKHTPTSIKSIKEGLHSKVDSTKLYQSSFNLGYDYGLNFRCIKEVNHDDNTALAKLKSNKKNINGKRVYLHPGLLDSIIHTLIVWSDRFTDKAENSDSIFLPVSLDKVLLIEHEIPEELWTYVSVKEKVGAIGGDFQVFNTRGEHLLEISGLNLVRAKKSNLIKDVGKNKLCYKVTWAEDRAVNKISSAKSDKILTLTDKVGLGSNLPEIFTSKNIRSIQVKTGNKFRKSKEDEYVINASSKADFETLRDELERREFRPQKIIFLWSLDYKFSEQKSAIDVENEITEMLTGLLHIVQVFGKQDELKLWIITQNAQMTDDDAAIQSPQQAALWGMGRVIELEYPDLFGGMIDINKLTIENNPQRLLSEINIPGDKYRVLRGDDERFTQRFQLVDLNSVKKTGVVIKSNAAYLITGGLGALGLMVAERLSKLKAGRIILMSRKSPDQDLKTRIEAIKSSGVEVDVVCGDIADEAFVSRLIKETTQHKYQLKGVFHAAGVLQDMPVMELNSDSIRAVLRPKLTGFWNLHKLTQNLDFFVSFSSAASILGNESQANYAAANAVIDSLTEYRRKKGLPATTINWGPWSDAGMAASDQNVLRQMREQGLKPLEPETALDIAFETIDRDLSQVVVVDADWELFFKSREYVGENRLIDLVRKSENQTKETSQKAVEKSEVIDRFSIFTPEARVNELSAYVASLALKVLGLEETEPLNHEKPLAEQGFDSLTSVDLRDLIAREFSIRLPVSFLFNYPTISEITNFIEKRVFAISKEKDLHLTKQEASEIDIDDLDMLSSDDLEDLIDRELGLE